MRVRMNGYIIKIRFWGDSTTPVYKFKLYQPRKWWFNKLLWVEDFHRERIITKDRACEILIQRYHENIERWK